MAASASPVAHAGAGAPMALGARLRTDARALAVAVPGLDPDAALRAVFAAFEHSLGLTPAARVTSERDPAARWDLRRYEAALDRLSGGVPLAHVLGEQPFRDRRYRVSAEVLVPRPDTEALVEACLERIHAGEPARVLDLGTGSGCIAIELALERPAAYVVAVDASPGALAVARANAAALGAGGIEFLQSRWYDALADRSFDLIVSNPPYIAEGDPHLAALVAEPRAALVSGHDGLDDLRLIVAGAPARLRDGGWLCVEHGFDQGGAVRALLLQAGFEAVATLPDAGGRERVCEGRWPGGAHGAPR